jgi:hypothetical protein
VVEYIREKENLKQTKSNHQLICMLKEHLDVGALRIEQRYSLVKSAGRYSSLRVNILRARVIIRERREPGAKRLSLPKICIGQVARFEGMQTTMLTNFR